MINSKYNSIFYYYYLDVMAIFDNSKMNNDPVKITCKLIDNLGRQSKEGRYTINKNEPVTTAISQFFLYINYIQ